MKIAKFIPDSITCGNLTCGLLGVVFAFEGRIDIAFPLMIAASVCDFFDGFAARALGAYSDLGKELDSLADLVSFGVLPAVMMVNIMKAYTWSNSALCLIPLVLAVCSGLRLAKFNVDERQHDNFLGLATPAAAMICGSLCYYIAGNPGSILAAWATGFIFLPVLAVVLSALLLTEIPMFSMKIKKGSDKSTNLKRISFLVNALLCILFVVIFHYNWSLAVTLIFTVYVLMNIVFAVVK